MESIIDPSTKTVLAASEYPVSLDALPSVYFKQAIISDESASDSSSSFSSNNFEQQAAPSARYNSIHRYTLSTRTIAHYCRLEKIGEGTYGQVYRSKCLNPTLSSPRGGEMVALKKIRLHHPGYWGIPPTVIREIKILKALQHKNMVKMYEVVSSKGVEELDWDDEREDEKRRKVDNNNLRGGSVNNNSSVVVHPGGSTTESIKNNDDDGGGGGTKRKAMSRTATGDNSTKKKKKNKDAMSDIDKLRESYKGNLFIVLEYISHDLTGLLDMAHKFTEVQIKSITKQLLEVLEFMHTRNYVHRDLKTSNVLITDRYEVKLADFGLARSLDSSFIGKISSSTDGHNVGEGDFTNKVITLWYRPPELLLGETKYGTAVDIWSCGCILAEIILGRPIFTGKTDMDQLKLIFDLIGTPNERTWEGFNELKFIRTGEVSIDKERRPKLREKYGSRIQPSTALGLLEKMLELDPKKRFTATRALHHRYFQSEPIAPEDPTTLGKIDLGGDGSGYHEFQTKKRRREAKAVAKLAEERAISMGEVLEVQKEAFDKAYRDYLKEGASADARNKVQQQVGLGQGGQQRLESYPWEEFQFQQQQQQQQRHKR